MEKLLMLIAMLARTSCYLVSASDPAPLQDFCVVDLTNSVKLNGYACKDPKCVQAEDFFASGLNVTPKEYNGSSLVTSADIRGTNTLGLSMARIDFAPYGVNSPHYHPRATEIMTVLEGSLEVGFITSSPENRHIFKVLNKGDVFVFPIGQVHYQRNVNNEPAVALGVWSSQSPGTIEIAKVVFASEPKINSDILVKAFHVDKTVIDHIQAAL